MNHDNELLNMLTNVKITSSKEKKIYREYKEAVKKFLGDGIETNKIKEIIEVCGEYCNNNIDLSNMDNLTDSLVRQLQDYVNNDSNVAIISHMVLLCKISTLYEMVIMKQEENRRKWNYASEIESIEGLREVLEGIKQDNIPFEHLCEISHLEEKKLNVILDKKKYFNVRCIGKQKLVSLAPEGRKVKEYLRRSCK